MTAKVFVYLTAALALAATARGAEFDPNAAVPVDVSIIEQSDGKTWTFQNTYAAPFYTYDKDELNKSHCDGKCAEVWVPVYPVGKDPADIPPNWNLVTRTDGTKQWAFHGKPIYTFGFGEHDPPTTKDIGKDWHILKP